MIVCLEKHHLITEDAEPTTGGGVTENGSLATPISSAYNPIVSQPNDSVNSQSSEKTSSQADTDMYKSLIEEYGAIYPGENPARDVQVPKNFLEII